jgi:hypothetical protein
MYFLNFSQKPLSLKILFSPLLKNLAVLVSIKHVTKLVLRLFLQDSGFY